MKKILITVICLSLIGCSSSLPTVQNTPSYPDLLIKLQRDVCFGTCPIYNLIVHFDGKVEYEGVAFVKIEGKQSSQISPAQIEELVNAIEAIDFFSLKDQYPPSVTDMPFIQLSITLNGQSKTIQHYGLLACGEEEALKKLCELEHKIDAIVNSSQWVGNK